MTHGSYTAICHPQGCSDLYLPAALAPWTSWLSVPLFSGRQCQSGAMICVPQLNHNLKAVGTNTPPARTALFGMCFILLDYSHGVFCPMSHGLCSTLAFAGVSDVSATHRVEQQCTGPRLWQPGLSSVAGKAS